jgi:hypothetical protein
MTKFRTHKKVEVRGANDRARTCRLVEERNGYCYLVPESEYCAARRAGTAGEARVGYPKCDVTEV